MSVIRSLKNRENPYVQLDRRMFDDPSLSLKAKGLIGFCLCKPDNWVFYIKQLSSALKEGEDAIASGLIECEKLGYALRYQSHRQNGEFERWETIISDSKEEIEKVKKELEKDPDIKKILTKRGFTLAGLPVPENPVLLNKDSSENDFTGLELPLLESPSTEPPEKVESESLEYLPLALKDKSGNLFETSLAHIFRRFTNTDFKTEEIKEAIAQARNYSDPVGDPYALLVGIIKNIRKKNSPLSSHKRNMHKNEQEAPSLTKEQFESIKSQAKEFMKKYTP